MSIQFKQRGSYGYCSAEELRSNYLLTYLNLTIKIKDYQLGVKA